jgi:glycosyltransferase involved in cell wall biosynthesis
MRAEYGLGPQSRAAETAKRALHRAVFRRARGFVGWSSWTKQSFVDDYGCRDEDVAVIPPGIDLSQFARGDRAHELPRILFVGADFTRKGGDLLLDVFRRRLRGRAELVVVTRAEVPEEKGVRVHRGVAANSPELRELFATSDIFALPTRADCFPLACMEALASELPIVATRAGGIPELVREGETGHLFDPGDAGTFGDALEMLVSDVHRREAMGRACREDATHRFEVRTNARRLFEFVRTRCA